MFHNKYLKTRHLFLLSLVAMAPSSVFSFAQAGELPAALVQLGDGQYFSKTALIVDKSKRLLTVWSKTTGGIAKVTEYPSDLGRKEGPKVSSGDYKTPEGIYFLMNMMEGSNLDFSQYGKKAFTTNYPNLFDQMEGKTGNGIWLHAVPDTVSLQRGSRGCVVLRNDAIADISQYIKLGATPIIILDSMAMVPEETSKTTSQALHKIFEDWRVAWESKNLDKYIEYYDEGFKSLGMTKNKWRAYKDNLNQKYQKIAVHFSEPVIYRSKGKVVIRALQGYNSDQHTDFGEKILYLVEKADNQFKIVGEEWAAVENAEGLQATLQTTRASAAAN